MGKRTLKTVLLVLVPLLVLLCGTTFALMLRKTDFLNNQFEVAEVKCAVVEDVENNIKNSIAVKNMGTIDAYLRVRLVSYWEDKEGNILSKPSVIPEITPANGWLKASDNTYYYPAPVAPDVVTPNLLSEGITLEEEDGCRQVIEVFADAIQSKPASAVTSSWGVGLTSRDGS